MEKKKTKPNTADNQNWPGDPVVDLANLPDQQPPASGPWEDFQQAPAQASGGPSLSTSDVSADDYGAMFTEPPNQFSQALTNAGQAGAELVGGMIPHDPYQYMKILYPPLAVPEQAREMVQGNFRSVPFVGRVQDIQDAEQTPAWSKERWLAGLKTLADVGMVAGAAGKRQTRVALTRLSGS